MSQNQYGLRAPRIKNPEQKSCWWLTQPSENAPSTQNVNIIAKNQNTSEGTAEKLKRANRQCVFQAEENLVTKQPMSIATKAAQLKH